MAVNKNRNHGNASSYLDAFVDSFNEPRKESTVERLAQSVTGVRRLEKRNGGDKLNQYLDPLHKNWHTQIQFNIRLVKAKVNTAYS